MKQFAIVTAVIASLAAASVAQAHPVQMKNHAGSESILESPVFQGD